MATVLKSQDRGKLNLQKSVQTLTDASFVLENGQSITYEQLLVLLSAALTVAAEWGSITGDITTQTDLWALLEGLQANIDSLLSAGYLTSTDAATTYVPYTGATTDVDLGTTINLILKLLKAKDVNGVCIKNSDGNAVVEFGNTGRTSIFYGHLLPDTDASRDLGNITSTLKAFNNAYVNNSIVINPSVGVSAVAMMDIITNETAKIGIIVKQRSGQTACMQEWRDSGGQAMSKISSKGFFQWAGQKRVTTQFSKTSSTTFSDITGLSVDVEAGKTYTFYAKLWVSAPASGGCKVAISGTCTATSIIVGGFIPTGNYGTSTSLSGSIVSTTGAVSTWAEIEGTITVNAAGTLTVQFAQGLSNATQSSVRVGSTFTVNQID